MDDWLLEMARGDRVLDIGSAGGSFATAGLACTVIAVDEDLGAVRVAKGRRRVVGRAEALPIATESIDLVICNHALEHFSALEAVLGEIGRVLKTGGRLYVSVPDGYGLCDGVYRWMFEGGGHVNRFRRDELVRMVEARVGLRLARWQYLYSSFVYMHLMLRLLDAPPADLQGRLKKLARLPRWIIRAVQRGLYVGTRAVDRVFGTETSVYGWALWFGGGSGAAVKTTGYVNVCWYCGSGHAEAERTGLGWRCSACGGRNGWWL